MTCYALDAALAHGDAKRAIFVTAAEILAPKSGFKLCSKCNPVVLRAA